MLQDAWAQFEPQRLMDMAIGFAPRVVAAVLVLFTFWLVTRLVQPTLRAVLRKADFDPALVRLLVDNVFHFTLLTIGVIMAASQLGIDVGAALAGVGVVGFAIGFAAKDSLSNTIAGFLIFWDKPFAVGDYVTTADLTGEVSKITMRTTRLKTLDNTYVVIPNREIMENVLVNHSLHGSSRVHVPIGIAYKEDVSEAREAILAVAADAPHVLADPEPEVVVDALGDSSVNLIFFAWIDDAARHEPVRRQLLETAKRALDEAGIEIPFPHLQLFVDDVQDRVWERALQTAIEPAMGARS
jgi:small-conductance mechanosensitive channel